MMWAGRMSRVAHIVGMSRSVGRSQVDGRAGERYRDQLRVIGVDKRRIQRIFLAVRRTSSVSGEHWTGRRSRRLYIGSHASGIGAGEAGGRARRSWPQTVGPWPSARAAESRGGLPGSEDGSGPVRRRAGRLSPRPIGENRLLLLGRKLARSISLKPNEQFKL